MSNSERGLVVTMNFGYEKLVLLPGLLQILRTIMLRKLTTDKQTEVKFNITSYKPAKCTFPKLIF